MWSVVSPPIGSSRKSRARRDQGIPLKRLASWALVGSIVVVCLGIAALDDAGPRTEAERVQTLSQTFACPECDGQSVADSNAAVASNIRDFLRAQVADGVPDDEIRDRLVEAYGSDVLLTPPSSGVSLIVWVLPALVVVLAVGAFVAVVLRGRSTDQATEDDRLLVASARKAAP